MTNDEDRNSIPALGDDDSGQPSGGRGMALVAAFLGLLIVVAIYVFGGSTSDGLVNQKPEEFKLRAAGRGPQDIGTSTTLGESDLDAERRKREDEEREAQRRAQDEAIQRQQAALVAQYSDRERDAEVNERKRAAEQAQRRREQEYAKRLKSSITIASTQSKSDAAASSGPAVNPADPFARDAAAAGAAITQAAGGSGEEPFAFLPPARSSRFDRTAAAFGGMQDMRISPGRLIRGVLETAISSDLPGGIRAIVSEDVYSEDGSQVLIPKMTRLWGEYRATVVQGQKRIGIIWSRLVRPDGVDVALRGIGTDALGMSGLTGEVDNKFWQRFGGAILQSMLEVAEDRASDNEELEIVASGAGSSSSVALQQAQSVQPTIYVDQGTSINVLIANDLDFRDVILNGLTQ